MKAILAIALFFYVQTCSGRYHQGLFLRHNPRIPLRKSALWDEGILLRESALWDEVCEDDPAYKDGCAERAAVPNYCEYEGEFMRKYCPRSCGFCSAETTKLPASVEPSLKPAAIECKDDPSYDCKDIAQTEGLCQEQEQFTRASCALSCGWCVPSKDKVPAPEICEEDLPKWRDRCPTWAEAGECDDQKKKIFMEHYCRKSCKLPCKPEPSPSPKTKAPSPPAFCRDRDSNCPHWKSLGICERNDTNTKLKMAVYCGITCNICKAPTPEECYDKPETNCEDLKNKGECNSTVPIMEYHVKTNCLVTCDFCVPDFP